MPRPRAATRRQGSNLRRRDGNILPEDKGKGQKEKLEKAAERKGQKSKQDRAIISKALGLLDSMETIVSDSPNKENAMALFSKMKAKLKTANSTAIVALVYYNVAILLHNQRMHVQAAGLLGDAAKLYKLHNSTSHAIKTTKIRAKCLISEARKHYPGNPDVAISHLSTAIASLQGLESADSVTYELAAAYLWRGLCKREISTQKSTTDGDNPIGNENAIEDVRQGLSLLESKKEVSKLQSLISPLLNAEGLLGLLSKFDEQASALGILRVAHEPINAESLPIHAQLLFSQARAYSAALNTENAIALSTAARKILSKFKAVKISLSKAHPALIAAHVLCAAFSTDQGNAEAGSAVAQEVANSLQSAIGRGLNHEMHATTATKPEAKTKTSSGDLLLLATAYRELARALCTGGTRLADAAACAAQAVDIVGVLMSRMGSLSNKKHGIPVSKFRACMEIARILETAGRIWEIIGDCDRAQHYLKTAETVLTAEDGKKSMVGIVLALARLRLARRMGRVQEARADLEELKVLDVESSNKEKEEEEEEDEDEEMEDICQDYGWEELRVERLLQLGSLESSISSDEQGGAKWFKEALNRTYGDSRLQQLPSLLRARVISKTWPADMERMEEMRKIVEGGEMGGELIASGILHSGAAMFLERDYQRAKLLYLYGNTLQRPQSIFSSLDVGLSRGLPSAIRSILSLADSSSTTTSSVGEAKGNIGAAKEKKQKKKKKPSVKKRKPSRRRKGRSTNEDIEEATATDEKRHQNHHFLVSPLHLHAQDCRGDSAHEDADSALLKQFAEMSLKKNKGGKRRNTAVRSARSKPSEEASSSCSPQTSSMSTMAALIHGSTGVLPRQHAMIARQEARLLAASRGEAADVDKNDDDDDDDDNDNTTTSVSSSSSSIMQFCSSAMVEAERLEKLRRDLLPPDWTVCSIHIGNDGKSLVVTRMSGGTDLPASPLAMKIRPPLSSSSSSESEEGASRIATIHNALKEMDRILQASDKLNNDAKAAGRGKMKSKEKKSWWTAKRQLDKDLDILTEGLLSQVFGPADGVLEPLPSLSRKRASLFSQALAIAKETALPPQLTLLMLLTSSSLGGDREGGGGGMAEGKAPADSLLNLCKNFLEQAAGKATNHLTNEAALAEMVRQAKAKLESDDLNDDEEQEEEEKKSRKCGPVVLVLGEGLHGLPWEMCSQLRGREVTRVPSIHFLYEKLIRSSKGQRRPRGVTPLRWKKAFYVLNPQKDLITTEATFKKKFSREEGWRGVCGEAPSKRDVGSALEDHDLYVYCGHSNGSRYLPGWEIRKLRGRAVALLMGCSSGRLRTEGVYPAHGIVNDLLIAGCPAVIANLWDVTDKDIDRFCESVMDLLKNGRSLNESVTQSRDKLRLPFLNGGSPVCYGIPRVAFSTKEEDDYDSNDHPRFFEDKCDYDENFTSKAKPKKSLDISLASSEHQASEATTSVASTKKSCRRVRTSEGKQRTETSEAPRQKSRLRRTRSTQSRKKRG